MSVNFLTSHFLLLSITYTHTQTHTRERTHTHTNTHTARKNRVLWFLAMYDDDVDNMIVIVFVCVCVLYVCIQHTVEWCSLIAEYCAMIAVETVGRLSALKWF